jgi:hypothetical protein
MLLRGTTLGDALSVTLPASLRDLLTKWQTSMIIFVFYFPAQSLTHWLYTEPKLYQTVLLASQVAGLAKVPRLTKPVCWLFKIA